jgi:hypothetical protein
VRRHTFWVLDTCALMLLHVCPHTATCVLILHMWLHPTRGRITGSLMRLKMMCSTPLKEASQLKAQLLRFQVPHQLCLVCVHVCVHVCVCVCVDFTYWKESTNPYISPPFQAVTCEKCKERQTDSQTDRERET